MCHLYNACNFQPEKKIYVVKFTTNRQLVYAIANTDEKILCLKSKSCMKTPVMEFTIKTPVTEFDILKKLYDMRLKQQFDSTQKCLS